MRAGTRVPPLPPCCAGFPSVPFPLETLFLCVTWILHGLESRLGRGISLISEHRTHEPGAGKGVGGKVMPPGRLLQEEAEAAAWIYEAKWTPKKAGTLRRISSNSPPSPPRGAYSRIHSARIHAAPQGLELEQAPASASSSRAQSRCETAETHCWKEEIVLQLQNNACNVLLPPARRKQCGCRFPGNLIPVQGLELGQGLPSRRGARGAGRPNPPRGAAWRARRAAPFEFLRRAHFECGPSQRHHDGGEYQ